MLRVSKLADYGTVVMVFFARRPMDSLWSAKEIAAGTHLRLPTVSKILKNLAKAGLLRSERGARGGYQLARSPSNVSITDILQALEGKSGLTECSDTHSQCVLQGVCAIRGNWQLINQTLYDALSGVSLKALAQPQGLSINTDAFQEFQEVE